MRLPWLVLWLLLSATVAAQVPQAVYLTRLRAYHQESANDVRALGFGLVAEVYFQTAAPVGTVIELRGPNSRVRALRVTAPDEYELVDEFPDEASLLAAYPDGTYTVVVGGNLGSSTNVTLRSAGPLAPVRISNFDELQGMRADRLDIQWEPIPGAAGDDRLVFTIVDITGREVFRTLSDFPTTSTSVIAPTFIPPAIYLKGTLVYFRLMNSTVNNGRTQVGTGDSFALEVPMMRLESPPALVYPPSSIMLRPGVVTSLSVTADRASSYEWRRDGTLLPGTGGGYMVRGEPAEAGIYTVTAINTAGRVSSEPFVVAVAPGLKFQPFAGQRGQRGVTDGPIESARFTRPSSVAMDRATGALYVIDQYAIRRIAGGQVSTLAGAVDQPGTADGFGTAARFMSPRCIAVGPTGDIYVGDAGAWDPNGWTRNHRVRRISPAGEVSTLGLPTSEVYAVGLIAVDAAGAVYTAGPNHQAILRIAPNGTASSMRPLDGDRPLSATAMAVDPTGALFVADSGSHAIFRVGANGAATRYAGSDVLKVNALAGVGTGVRLIGIDSMTFDTAGNLFAAGYGGFWMITPERRIVSLGDERPGGSEESGKVAIDSSGTVYISNSGDATLLSSRVSPGSVNPHITMMSAPTAQEVASGDAVALTVSVTGPSLSYQWLRNGVMLPRENDATLVVRNVTEAADYAVMVGNALGVVTTAPVRVTAVPATAPGRIVNLSLRSRAGTGAQSLIMGFVVGGGAGARDALVRGVGPGLVRFGVGDVLADPRLSLAGAEGVELATNDDYGSQPAVVPVAAAVGAFPLETGSKDAALLLPLAPNAYTVQVRGADGSEGIALAEAYDASASGRPGEARFVNVSARTVAASGDETLTAGVVIGGTTPKTVLIRAVGPGLRPFGVEDTLLNPRLDIFSGSTRVAGNDNWSGEALPGIFQAVGAFPLSSDSADAAIVLTLQPGAYTIAVSAAPAGVIGGRAERGVALIELYEVR